jgi:SNF2 family DNA or RNA helicase
VAILPDDMGLGKTFELLSLVAGLLERDRRIAPMLVVAPVLDLYPVTMLEGERMLHHEWQ